MVQAQDNGEPSLSTTLTVYCNVLDLNDNAPVFERSSYTVEIYENVTVGTPVVTVTASDIDSGERLLELCRAIRFHLKFSFSTRLFLLFGERINNHVNFN